MKISFYYSVILIFLALSGCSETTHLFELVPASETGISFNNLIIEDDSNNILDYEYLYNGGGVAVGDFNKDGLQDLYFTASMESNKLYLNQGAFKFKDATQHSLTTGNKRWCTGASVVDINNDSWPDIYVCTSRYNNPELRKNLLYVNQGNDKNGVPVFEEMADAYGLADTTFSTQAAFFDYDNDGDLDMYLLVAGKMQNNYQPNTYQKKITDGSSVTNDRLYRNDGIDSLNHPYFSDVTKEANILIEGFGLGVNITDINQDGWKDIYVSNDYLSNDLFWINNRNGTFTNKAGKFFKHTSYSAMGNDVQDINNDGLADVITLDMLAKDNYRKKMMSPPGNYFNYNNNNFFGYDFQYVRNTLQLNQGSKPPETDTIPDMIFSEISFLSGVAETDWSWSPLLADFDNDGYRDLIVSNGFPKDLSDQDFLHFRGTSSSVATKAMIIDEMPEVKIADYAFRNNGDLTFSNVSRDWGFNYKTFSNGAVYADLDNDGDLDCVTNNINDVASVYKNRLNEDKLADKHWLQLTLTGSDHNTMGYGTIVKIYYDSGKTQFTEFAPCRGYLSSVGNRVQFGLGASDIIDSIRVIWPDHHTQLMADVKCDQLVLLDLKNATGLWEFAEKNEIHSNFQNVTSVALAFKHKEADYIDFNEYKLLPHKFSQYGPSLAVGDIDGNGTEDVFVGGPRGYPGSFLIQDRGGNFSSKALLKNITEPKKVQEDQGSLLADFDNDGDLDLYIVSGGIESDNDTDGYRDRIYSNNGNGNFTLVVKVVLAFSASGSAIKGCDFDADGDIDLVRTGRLIPGQYPKPAATVILRNDSKKGSLVFTDITHTIAPFLLNAGLVSDASWTDFNNDGKVDLLLCGEWMAPMFIQNTGYSFKNVSAESGLGKETGWWNSIAAGDFDNDGDTDYILGNNGVNTLYRASITEPVNIYAKDFNQDGVFDAVPTLFLTDSNGIRKEYPAFGRDEMIRQIVQFRRKFPSFKSYASASVDQLFTSDEKKDVLNYKAVNMKTSYIENTGNNKFKISYLPLPAQFSPVFGIVVKDIDEDGNLDLVLNGNDYGIELSVGRCAALNGLMLRGNGKGHFIPMSIARSGILIPGNGKALVTLQGPDQKMYMMASQNNDSTLLFIKRSSNALVSVKTTDISAMIYYKDGRKRREELYYGNSFFSQSGRSLELTSLISHIEIFNIRGAKRMISKH